MKSFLRPLLVTLGLASALTLAAQTTYTDAFTSASGYWNADVTANNGAFTLNGVLNFTDAGLATGQTSSAYRDLNFAVSAAANWQLQMDFNLAVASQVGGQITTWKLYASALTAVPPNDYFEASLVQSYMQSGWRILNGTLTTNGSTAGTSNLGSLTPDIISLQLAYDAGAKTLTLGYDANGGSGGYSFTALQTADISTWLLTGSDNFGFRVMADNQAQGMASTGVSLGGSYADNFKLTTAAVPEPATYALAAGLAALAGLAWRGRRA